MFWGVYCPITPDYKNKNNKVDDMAQNNDVFLDMLREISREIKEIKKDNSQSAITLEKISSQLFNEIALRLRNEKDIENIKLTLQLDEKERDDITKKIYLLEAKADLLEREINDAKEFHTSMRKNLWKTLWWILGVVSTALTAGIAIFQSFFAK